jgi:clan AA aspartic protease
MPTFTKQVRFLNMQADRSAEAEALVDTGATFCHLPREIAERLRLTPTGSRRLRLANGQIVEYRVANALVQLVGQDEAVATSVLIGEPGSTVLLGALALDALGLGIDTEGRRLIPKVSDLLLETDWTTI